MAKISKRSGQTSKSGKFAIPINGSKAVRLSPVKPKRTTKVLGITKDGVRILKPRGKATHFTQRELRSAIASARAVKRA